MDPKRDITEMTFKRPPRYYSNATWPTLIGFWAMFALPCFVEAVLLVSDAGLRTRAYQNGAFWAGLLGDWQPNYAAQPVTMFLSYAVLHAGPAHLVGNMLAFIFLGHRILQWVGVGFFLLIYAGSAIGGGAGFALLSSAAQPMVGASGALFGLAGALLYNETRIRGHFGLTFGSVLAVIAGLVALNLLFWILEDGLLAWQAHLGGFVTGWVIMALIRRVRKADTRFMSDSSN